MFLAVSIPCCNATRWSSTFRQLNAVAGLESNKIGELLRESNHTKLIHSVEDLSILSELIQILQPFAEATDLT